MPELIGGRYRLDRELAAGGFGTVWAAFDTALRVEVAVKQVKLDPSATGAERDKAVARAEHEARNAARLRDHPHIVAVHDVVTERGAPWLVMQLVAGRSLHQELAARGRLSPDEAGPIAEAVLSALAAAHDAGIVHRDIKPANIMLAYDGTVLLTDFGIAKHHVDTAQTTLGTVIGSLPYMAPERLDGRDLAAGDLFALGATLYEMTEGVSPFARDSMTAVMSAVVLQHPEPPKHAGYLTSLVLALLAKDHTARPDARTALAMIKGSVAGATVAPAPPVAPTVVATVAAPVPAGGPETASARVAVASSAPVAETMAATAGAVGGPEAGSGRRHGRNLANELIRLAAGAGDQADEAQRVLWAMALRLADHDPRMAERLVDAIPETGWSGEARIALAQAVWPTDPQQARRLIANLAPQVEAGDRWEMLMTVCRIDVRAAERLIHSADESDGWKSNDLTVLATAVAAVDPAEGERLARSVPSDEERPAALARVAAVIAAAHAGRARELTEEAVIAAAALTDRAERSEALYKVTCAVAMFDPHRAEQIARSITEPLDRRERRRVRQGTFVDGDAVQWFPPALAAVAAVVAPTDPRRGWQLAEEAEAAKFSPEHFHLGFVDQSPFVEMLAHLALASVATDPHRARRLAESALHVADTEYGYYSVDAAAALAGAFPDLAERIATGLTWKYQRDEMLARLAVSHPEVGAQLRAATPPTASSVLAAAATDPYLAAGRARAIVDTEHRFAVLVQLAEAIADRAPDLAGRLCDDAENSILDDPDFFAVVDLLSTAARAAADPDRARTLPDALLRIAEAVPAGPARDAALGTAATLVAGFDPGRAEAVARSLGDDRWRLWPLGLVACCLIRGTDPRTWEPATAAVTFAANALFTPEWNK
ncbi:serine/threonine-protein kinase [Catenulispora subtropica]|uniref:Protein kinase domain-containing protein n=1 Tax=Catenulispora subtropica TaxID=450798 RepID=A0ABN2RRX5_9ACTN